MEKAHLRKKKINRLVRVFTVILLVGIGYYTAFRMLYWGNVEFTENAQVKQLVVPVNNRIQGYIREITFNEYQPVCKGDTLIIIEDEQYRLQLSEAEVQYQQALTEQTEIELALMSAVNDINVAESNIEKAKIEKENSFTTYSRYQRLLEKEAVTRELFDHARTDYDVKKTQYETLLKGQKNVILKKKQQEQKLKQVEAQIRLAELKRETASLHLSYTVVIAPCEGVIGRKNIQVGQLVQNGQTLVDIVDSREKWITANFRESQIAHIREGQKVEIKADAYPGESFMGIVQSLSDATGAAFSLIPQDNATGNFVKVEQRIPVRIEFDAQTSQECLKRLRAGMNVECLIRY